MSRSEKSAYLKLFFALAHPLGVAQWIQEAVRPALGGAVRPRPTLNGHQQYEDVLVAAESDEMWVISERRSSRIVPFTSVPSVCVKCGRFQGLSPTESGR